MKSMETSMFSLTVMWPSPICWNFNVFTGWNTRMQTLMKLAWLTVKGRHKTLKFQHFSVEEKDIDIQDMETSMFSLAVICVLWFCWNFNVFSGWNVRMWTLRKLTCLTVKGRCKTLKFQHFSLNKKDIEVQVHLFTDCNVVLVILLKFQRFHWLQ